MKISRQFPYFKQEGIDYVAAAGKRGVSVDGFLVTSGGTPDAVLFSDHGLPEMANAEYVVMVNGETAGQVNVDESTKATTGFSILGGVSGEVLNVTVIGTKKGQRS